jgi:hypothetical protein
MGTRRGLLAAVVAVALLVPLAPAIADRGHGHGHGDHGHHKRFSALIFSKTAAFRHTQCIPQGTVAIAQAAQDRGFRDGGRLAVHRREPRQVRRGDLPVHDR